MKLQQRLQKWQQVAVVLTLLVRTRAALEQEGRALVMGTVFDARLSTDAGSELRR